MITSEEIKKLEGIAREIRIDILGMLNEAKSGHTGGSLSATDIVTALFFSKMKHQPKDPEWAGRDRFVLSKGHAAPLLYAVLAKCGYFSRDKLMSLRKLKSSLQGHPDMRKTKGVEVSTGSLGQGLSMANGMAIAARLNRSKSRTYVLLGDGESQEGQVWEAAMSAAHYKLDNLCAILDNNGLQIDGPTKEVMDIDPLPEKWQAFNWNVLTIDGHNFGEILEALASAEVVKKKPTIIIAKTIKGKGVSFFENKVRYHGIAPSDEELENAFMELRREEN